VAGIIAGQEFEPADREQAYYGIAPQTQLHVYKVLRDDGEGRDSWIIKALDHIAILNEKSGKLVVHGVNLSLGGPFDAEVFGCGHSPLCEELRRLWRIGVLVCVAAGNEGVANLVTVGPDGRSLEQLQLNSDLSIGDPANLEEAIAVGSVHKEFPHLYGVSYFSSRGPTADGRGKPDVVAPGEKIESCNSSFIEQDRATHYIPLSGTSMACPHVSGLLAAFLSVRREFLGRPDEVKRLLLQHAIDLGRDRYHQGAGMPNLIHMLAGT
jgi:subtilisin family serine protease